MASQHRKQRYLSIYFPHLSMERIADGTGSAECCLVNETGRLPTVVQCSELAFNRGIRPGMSIGLAKAMAPEAIVRHHQPLKDCWALFQLARWAQSRIAPLSGLDGAVVRRIQRREFASIASFDYGIIIDCTGTERLHHGERNLQSMIIERFKSAKLSCRTAITPTIASGWALTRFGNESHSCIDAVEGNTLLHRLPIEALQIDTSTSSDLREIGIETIADVLRIPRSMLGSRFGESALAACDRLHGRVAEPFFIVRPSSPVVATIHSDTPLHDEGSIATVIDALARRLVQQLRDRSASTSRIVLTVHATLPSGATLSRERTLRFHRATRDESHIRHIMQSSLEGMNIIGGVTTCSAEACVGGADNSQQLSFFDAPGRCSEGDIAELLDTLVLRLSDEQIYLPSYRPSHLPERAAEHRPLPVWIASREQSSPEATSYATIYNRPSYILPRPERIATIALLPDYSPSVIQWRDQRLKVVRGFGPERIGCEWWRRGSNTEAEAHRDYFQVQDEYGRWLWVFRDSQTREWYVHGVWS